MHFIPWLPTALHRKEQLTARPLHQLTGQRSLHTNLWVADPHWNKHTSGVRLCHFPAFTLEDYVQKLHRAPAVLSLLLPVPTGGKEVPFPSHPLARKPSEECQQHQGCQLLLKPFLSSFSWNSTSWHPRLQDTMKIREKHATPSKGCNTSEKAI